MSELIAQNLNRTPEKILRLFKAVIEARSTMHNFFERIADHQSDPVIMRSNSTHKHFIDALKEALDTLHNSTTREDQAFWTTSGPIDETLNQDQFSSLNVGNTRDDDSSSSEDMESSKQSSPQPRTKGRKKGKKGKKQQKEASDNNQDRALANVPLESYRIDQDHDMSEYLLAASSVVLEWIELRSYIQDLWREVAYDGLNGAVAATLTFSAVAMVKQTCSAVFVDFPGLEYYNKIIEAVKGGDGGESQLDLRANHTLPSQKSSEMTTTTRELDAEENFFEHTYNDLVSFLEDFRKNRTGKPTKAMQARLNKWNPNLDLQECSDEERLNWRRTYTIIWLYDLVNVFKAPVLACSILYDKEYVYEDIDWSPTGHWKAYRRLFGLNEFAGDITGFCFARQKKGRRVHNEVLPHHVFQLQCIVDSFTVSRGWYLSTDQGHVITSNPLDFHPLRDLDPFLGRDPKVHGQGVLPALKYLLDRYRNNVDQADPNRTEARCSILDKLAYDFDIHLGRSKICQPNSSGVTVASLFSKFNPIGWWEYSPLLCAAGLVEALILVQRVGMCIWNAKSEHELSMQLHDILLRSGFLREGVPLWKEMDLLFRDSFFSLADFRKRSIRGWWKKDPEVLRQRRMVIHSDRRDSHAVFNAKLNEHCRVESVLTTYYDAGWIPDHIPDNDLKIPSAMATIRLMAVIRADKDTNSKKETQESDLMKRARSCPETCKILFEQTAPFSPKANSVDASASDSPRRDPYRVSRMKKDEEPQGRALLEQLRADIFDDVCGKRPLSALNYMLVTATILKLFDDFEKRCEETHLPLWEEFMATAPAKCKRSAFILRIMITMDPEALKLLAESFEDIRQSVETFTYWETHKDDSKAHVKTAST